MFFQVLPLSRVMWNGPSFEPTQMTPGSCGDSVME